MKLQDQFDTFVRSRRDEARKLYDDRVKGSIAWLEDHLPQLRREAEKAEQRGGKAALRLYDDRIKGSLAWVEDHLPRLRREAAKAEARGGKAVRNVYDERLRTPVTWIEEHLPQPKSAGSILVPTLIAAGAAGAAVWWWTQWARGREEAAARAALDAQGGAEGKAHPEAVMAHAPEPPEAPVNAADRSAAKLSEPAPEVMAHNVAPKGPAALKAKPGARAKPKGKVGTVIPPAAAKSLDESLAVQAKPPKRKPGEALN